MKTTSSLKCPHCGAPLNYKDEEKSSLCEYCGSIVAITNENEHVLYTIDEAEIQRTKFEREIRLKELELEKNKGVNKQSF